VGGGRTVGALLERGKGDASDDGQQHAGLGHGGRLAVEDRVDEGREHRLAAAARRGGAARGWWWVGVSGGLGGGGGMGGHRAAEAAEGAGGGRSVLPSQRALRHCEGVCCGGRGMPGLLALTMTLTLTLTTDPNPNPNPNPNQVVEAHPALTI